MGRPRTRYAAAERALEDWGDWLAKLFAFAGRSTTPEGRALDEAEGAVFGSFPAGSRPALPQWMKLKTPAYILTVESTVAGMQPELAALATMVYVRGMRRADIIRQSSLTAQQYDDSLTAILVTVDLATKQAA